MKFSGRKKNLKQDIRKGCSATDQKKGPILCPTAKTKNLCIDRNLESQRVSGFPPTKKGCRIAYRGVTSIHEGFRAFIMHFFCSCLRLAGNCWLIMQCNKHNKHFCSLHSWCMFQDWSPILVRISSFIQKERPFVAHDGISIYGGKWKTCARLSVPSVDLRCDVSNGHLLWTTNIEHLYKEMLNSATVCGSWSSWCKCLVRTYNIISTNVFQPLSETIISYGERVEVFNEWKWLLKAVRERRKTFFSGESRQTRNSRTTCNHFRSH